MPTYVLEESAYTKNNIVMLWARDIDTKEIRSFAIQNFKPYFYVPDAAGQFISCYNTPLRKIECDSPADLKQRLQFFKESYDADIPLDMRWRIDHKIMYAFDENFAPVEIEAPLAPKIMFYDIEVQAADEFPTPELAEYPIVSIATYNSYNDAITVFTTLPIKGARQYKSEKAMIEAFARYVKTEDFDVISGWYNQSFDDLYIFNRAAKVYANIAGFSRTRQKRPWERDIYTTRTNIDLMEVFKAWSLPKGTQPSYNLKYISEHFAGFKYDDYGAAIDDLIKQKRFKALYDYACNDVIALARINKACDLINFYENLRKMTGVKLNMVLQKTRIYEYYLMFSFDYPLPTRTGNPREPFEGGYVKEPIAGIHHNVASFDLKSLYPSIIVAYNVSPDKFNMLPKVIIKLMDKREELRKMRLAGIGGETVRVSEQSIKYVINSAYGVLAYPNFKLFNMAAAKFIPKKGQDVIKAIIQYLEDNKYNVAYGDSVAGDTKLNIIDNGALVRNINIEDLFTSVDYCNTFNGKEYCRLRGIKINSLGKNGDSILVDAPYIMRHKVDKQMYRVWLNNIEYVDVTEDHSLFGYLNKSKLTMGDITDKIVPVAPLDIGLKVKSLIVQKYLQSNIESKNYPKLTYELMGMFLGDGSFGDCKKSSGIRLSTGLDTEEIINKIISPLLDIGEISTYKTYPNGDMRIGGNVTKIIHKYMKNDKTIKCKLFRIPEFIYTETYENKCAFLRGLFDADGTVILKNNSPIIRFTSIYKELCEDVKQLLLTVGVSASIFKGNTINKYKTNNKIYCTNSNSYYVIVKSVDIFKNNVGFNISRKHSRIIINENSLMKKTYINMDFDLSKVNIIEKITYDDYVYDLSVDDENHRYFIGNGILVHNTDSVFAKPVESVTAGLQLQADINNFLIEFAERDGATEPCVIKFETWYKTIFYRGKISGDAVAKKKYIGHVIWEDGNDVNKLAYKGIELKRSDTAQITKTAMTEFFTKLLIENDRAGAIKYIVRLVNAICLGKVPLQDLAHPRGYKTDVKSPHQRAIRNSKNVLKFNMRRERKVNLIWCKSPCKEIAIDSEMSEYFLKSKITPDYRLMMEKNIKQKFEPIFRSLGTSWEAEIDRQISLAVFM